VTPTELLPEWRNDKLLRFFMRHVVPIYVQLRQGRERKSVLFTAFLFSVYDHWLLMTAGHCITRMRQWRAAGWQLVVCRLVDSLGTNARFIGHAVPFDYDGSDPQMLGRHHTYDFGILILADNTRAQLAANDCVPFDESFWAPATEPIEDYQLVGLPEELTFETAPNRITMSPMAMRVAKVDERPEGFEPTTAEMFYGRLPTRPLASLRGMSGGPILALGREEGGERRYWLHAMQVSTWEEYVSGMVMSPLGQLLREICEGRHG
jgi:hypothetical protein